MVFTVYFYLTISFYEWLWFRLKSEVEAGRQKNAWIFDEHGLEPTQMHEMLFLGCFEAVFSYKIKCVREAGFLLFRKWNLRCILWRQNKKWVDYSFGIRDRKISINLTDDFQNPSYYVYDILLYIDLKNKISLLPSLFAV